MTTLAIRELRARELHIPFKTSFRHASAERAETSSVWVEAMSARGRVGYGESCPRPYVTGETIDTVKAFVSALETEQMSRLGTVDAMRDWLSANHDAIDKHPAAWCATELALLDLIGKEQGVPVDALLGLSAPRGPFHYSAVLGDAQPQAFAAAAERYRQSHFSDFKIKLSGRLSDDRAKVEVLRSWNLDGLRLRVDANNLWTRADDAIAFLRDLDCPLFAIEEPLAPNQYDELGRIADALGSRIVLDESLLRAEQLKRVPPPSGRWLVNVRVSKMGGLLRSMDVVRAARAAGMGIIVGAQVGETSVLTRAALTVAMAAGPDLVAQEGAFGTHLLASDVCEPPLMFGPAGVLHVPSAILDAPGFGLPISAAHRAAT